MCNKKEETGYLQDSFSNPWALVINRLFISLSVLSWGGKMS